MAQLVVPQGNARLDHPDLDVDQPELRDVGHLSLPIDARALHWVAGNLARSDRRRPLFRDGRARSGPAAGTFGARSSPAS